MIQAPDRPITPRSAAGMTYLLGLRLAFAAIVLAWSGWPGGARCAAHDARGLSGAYVIVAPSSSGPGGTSALRLRAHAGLLLLDGLYLAFAMYATGGRRARCGSWYLHLVAVSLLASYRTGLKIALWHSLLFFVVLYAQAATFLPPVDVVAGSEIVFDRMPVLNVTFVLAVRPGDLGLLGDERAGTRQRRADLEAFVDLGSGWTTRATRSPGAHRARRPRPPVRLRTRPLVGATEGKVVILAARGVADVPTAAVDPDPIIVKAWEHREPLAVRRLDGERNRLLAWALMNARNLLVAPMFADGRRSVPRLRASVAHHLRVERRVTSVLGQFAALRGPEPTQCGAAAARPGPGGARLPDRRRQPAHVPADP